MVKKYAVNISIYRGESLRAVLYQPNLTLGILGLAILIPDFYKSLDDYPIPYKQLADDGWALLCVDPITVEKGQKSAFHIEKATANILKALDKLLHHLPHLKGIPIGIIGHGTGAHIGYLMASVDSRVNYVSAISLTSSLKDWFFSMRKKQTLEKYFYARIETRYPKQFLDSIFESENPINRILENRFIQKGLRYFPISFGHAYYGNLLGFVKEIFMGTDLLTTVTDFDKPTLVLAGKYDPEGNPLASLTWLRQIEKINPAASFELLESYDHNHANIFGSLMLKSAAFFTRQLDHSLIQKFRKTQDRMREFLINKLNMADENSHNMKVP